MSIVKRIGSVAAVVAVLAPATAHAATSTSTPVAAARAYVAALGRHDAEGACALTAPSVRRSRQDCRRGLETSATILRARIEPGALTRGTRARVVVGLVVEEDGFAPRVSRTRLLLHRIDGRWRVAAAGEPIALGTWDELAAPDPAPAGGTAALRRLADDELLALSGNATMLCHLLAPGAPLADGGGCVRAAIGGLDDAALAVRLAGFAAHLTAPGRARLDLTAVVTRAVRGTRRPGYALRSKRWSDTVFAVRAGGRWKLVKPSRSVYRALRLPAPTDVGSPSATAVWPARDAGVPSLSERAAPPECRTPPDLWAFTCFHVDGLAAGAGLVAWSVGYAASARPVAAGAAAGPTTTVTALDRRDPRLWWVAGIAQAGDGALVIETAFDLATRAVPVGRDGRPSGPVQLVDGGVADGVFDNAVGHGAVVVPAPAGAATATVLTATRRIVRLGADGRPTGPVGTLAEELPIDDGQLVARPDGTFLWFGRGADGDGIAVTALDAGGSVVGTPVTLPNVGAPLGASYAAAEDTAGRVLVGWVEEGGGRRTLRTWVYDPSAPTSTAPVARARWTSAESDDADRVDVTALPDGGWGLAWSVGGGLWAGRLPPSGAWVARPRRVAAPFLATLIGARGFALAGDTVAWIAPPALAGLSQVRSARLP